MVENNFSALATSSHSFESANPGNFIVYFSYFQTDFLQKKL